jgi:hypothetical protein
VTPQILDWVVLMVHQQSNSHSFRQIGMILLIIILLFYYCDEVWDWIQKSS